MARGKLLKAGIGLGTGSAAREGMEREVIDIPESVINTVEAVGAANILGSGSKWLYNKLPESYKKKVPFRKWDKALKKQVKDKVTSKKAIAKRGAKMAGSVLAGPLAPALNVGFLGHDIYDIGKTLYGLGKQKVTGRKKGGQIKKTKRKAGSRPRGVGKALRGYGSVSR